MDNIKKRKNIINDTADIPSITPSDIFSNELILEHIFKNLRVRDLKHCRGVNILWCREATKSLLKNYEVLQPIKIEKERNGNYKFRILKERSMDADDFVVMVSTSILFPCNNISLRICVLETTTIQSFLNSYGGNVKQLEIWDDLDEDKELEGPIVKIIEDLLTKQVTKLQCLKIQGGSISASTEFLNEAKLKNLTKLNISTTCTYKSNSKEFIQRILIAAVNLKVVTFDNEADVYKTSSILEAIVGFGKAHLLDRCDFFILFSFSSNIKEQINVYEAVVSSKPKLKTISLGLFRLYFPTEAYVSLLRLASIISKCLELNSENLVDIHHIDEFLRLPGLRIPRLAKVKSLQSEMNALKLMEGNHLALSFVETFPNLKSIIFHFSHPDGNAEACNYLGNVIPCLNVTYCDYGTYSSFSLFPKLLQYFAEKFPNLTHFKCRSTTEFIEASEHIWRKLIQLESIVIQIGYTSASAEANYPGLEAAFTGFSSETCLRLKDCITEGKDVNVEFPNLEELRLNPSILNLKKLTFLGLTFDNSGYTTSSWENWAPTSPLLTAVTGQFAFALCPKLRVNIKIRPRKGDSNAWSNESNPFLGVEPFLNVVNIDERLPIRVNNVFYKFC